MKETSPDLERLGQFAAMRPGRFRCCAAGRRCVSGTRRAARRARFWPSPTWCPTNACGSTIASRRAATTKRSSCSALTPLAQLVTTVYGVAGLKVALELAGFHGGPVRAPLLPATSKVREEIAARRAHALQGRGVAPRRPAPPERCRVRRVASPAAWPAGSSRVRPWPLPA